MMIRFSGMLISADQDQVFITSCRSGSSDLKSVLIKIQSYIASCCSSCSCITSVNQNPVLYHVDPALLI